MESNNNQTRSDDNSIILDDDKVEVETRIREAPPGSRSGEYNYGSAYTPAKRNRKRSYSEEKVMKEPFLKEEKDRSVKKEKKRKDPTFVEARDFHQVVFENINLTAQFEDPETHDIVTKQVLLDVNGKAQSGQILGIIGNSGTGKTSLLRVLRGEIFIKRGEKATGNLLIDGIPVNIQHNKEEMKKLYGIDEKEPVPEPQQVQVPQGVKGKLDVNFIGETVEEHGSSTIRELLVDVGAQYLPKSSRLAIINSVLDDFDLRQYCDVPLDSSVNPVPLLFLRRFVIAREIIKRNSDIIFLDGQTKSLTTKEELAYLETVSMLARRGYLIIMTLTAPTMEMFEIIDSVVMLNNDGTQRYSGPAMQSFEFFNFKPHLFQLFSL
eukprot:TRINITY_DN7754_c0_g1_i1.p1 TRINITY_DN7754_c0_g1~~TRINITY_DN7754_c0_g1_i1.p1  ORF type:complete len:379 (-),score=58.28 TRINITY_DN7754_c0_g1_i1:2-1138(-)